MPGNVATESGRNGSQIRQSARLIRPISRRTQFGDGDCVDASTRCCRNESQTLCVEVPSPHFRPASPTIIFQRITNQHSGIDTRRFIDIGRRQTVMSTPLPPQPRPERPHLTALPTSSMDSELALLREQNQQLRDLVVQLSKVVVKQVLEK